MPTELVRFAAGAAQVEAVLAQLERDGAVIVEGVLPRDQTRAIVDELEPFIAGTLPIDDDFVGKKTTRTGGLVARSKSARDAIAHTLVLDVAKPFLTRYSENFQLNLTQVMRLLPGQEAQRLHRDRYLWSRHLPREVEPMLNVMWALTDFTEENGATRVLPGSQRWDWDRAGRPEDTIGAVMPEGSLLFYTGSVLHGGGANRSQAPRIGMNITYLLGWLRQEENQYLSCPPDVAKDLPPALQALLGYTVGNGSLGYYSPPKPPRGRPDTLPPECAVGGRGAHAEQKPF